MLSQKNRFNTFSYHQFLYYWWEENTFTATKTWQPEVYRADNSFVIQLVVIRIQYRF